MESSQFSKSLIALYKRGAASMPGIYIVDGETHNQNGINERMPTASRWFRQHSYAFSEEQLMEPGMVYVKEGLQDRKKATAIIVTAYRTAADLAIRIVQKATPKEIVEAQAMKAANDAARAEIISRAKY
jgi:hypothetical protein